MLRFSLGITLTDYTRAEGETVKSRHGSPSSLSARLDGTAENSRVRGVCGAGNGNPAGCGCCTLEQSGAKDGIVFVWSRREATAVGAK